MPTGDARSPRRAAAARRRRAFAAEAVCGAAPSVEVALDHTEVEGALLLTPNDTHADLAVACAERGVHVFVEKPIADTVPDAERMAIACREAGVTLMVGHAFRRLGAARKVAQLVEEGALGRVVLAEATFSLPGALTPDKWRAHRGRNPGGPLMQLGIHHVDTLASWLGEPVGATRRVAHPPSAAGRGAAAARTCIPRRRSTTWGSSPSGWPPVASRRCRAATCRRRRSRCGGPAPARC